MDRVQPLNLFARTMGGMQAGREDLERERATQAQNALSQALQSGGPESPEAMAALGRLNPLAAMQFGVQRSDRRADLERQDRAFGLQERQFEAGLEQWERQFALSRAKLGQAIANRNEAAAAREQSAQQQGLQALVSAVVSAPPEKMPTLYAGAVQAALRVGAISEDALSRLPDPANATADEIVALGAAMGIAPPEVAAAPPRFLSAAEREIYGIPPEDRRPFVLDPATNMAKPATQGLNTGPDVVVNTGDTGVRTGPIPAGFAAVPDPNSPAGVRQVPIPGSPAAREAEAAAAAGDVKREQQATYNDVVLTDVRRVIDLVERFPMATAGIGGAMMSRLPGTPASDASALIDTVVANIGFDRLQAMREASPTGGALGAVTENELRLLQTTLGALRQSQRPEQLLFNLRRVEAIYEEILRKAQAYENAAQFGFGDGPAASPGTSLTAPTSPGSAGRRGGRGPDAFPQSGISVDDLLRLYGEE